MPTTLVPFPHQSKSLGSNAYPGGAGYAGSRTGDFTRLLKSLQLLTGQKLNC